MDKNDCVAEELGKGMMAIYDFGDIRLHAYKTNDPIDDEVFIVERGNRGVIIEAPCFFDNIEELEGYIAKKDISIEGLLIAYHGAGASLYPGTKVYSTHRADDYNHNGGGAALVSNFTAAFGDAFDNGIFTTTNYIEAGMLEIAGMAFEIVDTQEAFDIRIPGIGAVYTHMLGHGSHSIVAGADHADAIIARLEGYRRDGIDLVLTSHYTPEDLKDVQTKVDYLRELKTLAASSTDADAFKAAVKAHYPGYAGDNYLDMTAGYFFAA